MLCQISTFWWKLVAVSYAIYPPSQCLNFLDKAQDKSYFFCWGGGGAGLNFLLLDLKMEEGGYGPRNVGSLWELRTAVADSSKIIGTSALPAQGTQFCQQPPCPWKLIPPRAS